jgi:hypothetical protein
MKNNIDSNLDEGIGFRWGSGYNTITYNNISNNFDGIYIPKNENHNNNIYHNNFINNDENAFDLCNNTWDDGEYGNYWSDYKEKYPYARPKILKPWVWNTPYEIPRGDSKDMYPLVNQWPSTKSKTISEISKSRTFSKTGTYTTQGQDKYTSDFKIDWILLKDIIPRNKGTYNLFLLISLF